MHLSWRTRYMADSGPYLLTIELDGDGLFIWYCIESYGTAIPVVAQCERPFVSFEQAQRDAEAWLYAKLGVEQDDE